jgi:hypothetical protein
MFITALEDSGFEHKTEYKQSLVELFEELVDHDVDVDEKLNSEDC